MADFITLNECKDYLDIERMENKYNVILSSLISSMTQSIKNWCDRDIESTSYSEKHDIGINQDILQG